jgi:hypothetical protein
LRRLFVVLAADMTNEGNLHRVRTLQSRVSSMNDPYVVVVPPERAWSLLFLSSPPG